MNNFSIHVKQYNCFDDVTIFDELKRVNVLIGRNNSGKSSVLDIVKQVVDLSYRSPKYKYNITHRLLLTERVLLDIKKKTELGVFNMEYIEEVHDDYLSWISERDDGMVVIGSSTPIKKKVVEKPKRKIASDNFWNYSFGDYLKNIHNPLEKKSFKRLSAERDITPEFGSNSSPIIKSNGNGVTNAVESYIHLSKLSEESDEIIKNKFLPALNEVFSQDGLFSDLTCKKDEKDKWEIFFEEKHKKPIALSKSGSGFKTVILVLAFLILVPEIEKKPLSDYVFGFEELENNLHPALLRRLNNYIYKLSVEEDFTYFLTTHSSVMIDQFSNQGDAQIVHVTQADGKSSCRVVETYTHNHSVLKDLDVRASDLLQANGVIWVEGPSDVIYLRRWLESYSNEKNIEQFVQGRDFEFHMFGGTLLDSLSLVKSDGKGEEEYKKLVSMFSFSRNAYVVVDSDAVKNSDGKIIDKSNFQKAKQYIKSQFDELSQNNANLGLWYKEGDTNIRTMENYLDESSLQLIKENSWTKKVAAQKITESWVKNKKLSDFPNNLENEIDTLYKMIKSWNS